MIWKYLALAITVAAVGCADATGPASQSSQDGSSAAAPALVATVGALGSLIQPTLDHLAAREGTTASAAAAAPLIQTRARFLERVAAGDAVGAYEWENQLRLQSAERIAAELGQGAFQALLGSADTARDQLQARLRDGSGDGTGPLQDRLRLTDRLHAAATAAAGAGRLPAAIDYAAQALETAAGWQGPPEWAGPFGDVDRLQLRDGSCDSDGDGIPDRDRDRARDGTGTGTAG